MILSLIGVPTRARAWATREHQELGTASYLAACASVEVAITTNEKAPAPMSAGASRLRAVHGISSAHLYGDATAIAGDFVGHPSEVLSPHGAWKFETPALLPSANLVGSSCFNANLQQRELAEPGGKPTHYFVMRDCRSRVFVRFRGHAGSSQRVAAYSCVDGASFPFHRALHQRDVGLFDVTAGEHRSQGSMRAIVLGHNDQAARVFIEPVHDARPKIAARRRKSFKAIE